MVGKSAVLEARVVGKSAAGSEGGGEICGWKRVWWVNLLLEARVVGKSAAGSEGGGEFCCTQAVEAMH